MRTEEGDHEKFSHYVPKDELTEAMIMGHPVDGAVRQGVGSQP